MRKNKAYYIEDMKQADLNATLENIKRDKVSLMQNLYKLSVFIRDELLTDKKINDYFVNKLEDLNDKIIIKFQIKNYNLFIKITPDNIYLNFASNGIDKAIFDTSGFVENYNIAIDLLKEVILKEIDYIQSEEHTK